VRGSLLAFNRALLTATMAVTPFAESYLMPVTSYNNYDSLGAVIRSAISVYRSACVGWKMPHSKTRTRFSMFPLHFVPVTIGNTANTSAFQRRVLSKSLASSEMDE